MFTLNLRSWRDDPWIRDRVTPGDLDVLAADLAAAAGGGPVRWTLRQLVLSG
jgi:hypothetical protein